MSQLALELRPDTLGQIQGNPHVKKAIQSWIDADNFPRTQLYIGPVGCGKSSIAEIVSRLCQGKEGAQDADIRVKNAGAVGKVADMRELISDLGDGPPWTGKYKVIIFEEAHKITDDAQDALLVPMEKNEHVIWIFTSSEPAKLLAAVRSRCSAATFTMQPLNLQEMTELGEKALVHRNPDGVWQPKTDEAVEWLFKKNIRHPREFLGVLDQFFSGVPLEQCVHGAEHEPLYKDVCGAVLRGDWAKASGFLAQIKTADSRGLTSVLSAFLRSEILKNPVGPKADSLAACLVGIDQTGFQDGTAYGAVTGLIYKTCKAIGGGR